MRTVYKDCHSNNNTINFIQIYMLFVWGCTPHDLPLDKHVASGETVLLRAASVASPIKLTICFCSSMRSHSFAVAAVNKKGSLFLLLLFPWVWKSSSLLGNIRLRAAPETAGMGIPWFVLTGLVNQLTINDRTVFPNALKAETLVEIRFISFKLLEF